MPRRFRTILHSAWRISPPLTAVTALMLACFAGALAGLWLDQRVIAGAPAWLKPAKFGISTAIYGATLLWIFAALPEWPRTRRITGWLTAIVFVLEIGIIDLQAWRGTTSHFNTSTPFDQTLFAVMGTAIILQTVGAGWVAFALWRHRFSDAALAWALRLGMTISVVGASLGGLMTAPTSAQREEMQYRTPVTVGAHTVGAPDGGPGLPGTGWSIEAGDIRIPHFVGLHAMQVLPLFLLALPRRTSAAARVRAVGIAAASYLTLFSLLTWQALRAESIVHPSRSTLIALALWALLSLSALFFVLLPRPSTLGNGALHSA